MVSLVYRRAAPCPAFIFCLALFVFLATTQAQTTLKSPHGIFDMSANGYTNAAVDGRRQQILWTDIQGESETQYDWSMIDKSIALAKTYQKQYGVSLVILSAPPAWLTAIPGVKTYLLPPKNGMTMPIVLPWDPLVQPKIINFITQLCQHYDGQLDYFVMGGLGFNTESYMPDPDEIGLDMTLSDAVIAWTTSSNAIIDAYGANLHSTPFIIAAGNPFSGTDAQTALTNVISRAATMYGAHFGIMQWGLSANSNTGFLINSLIQQYSPTNPVGFQFLCPAAGNDNGQVLNGTLQQTLDAGVALGAHWIEVYGEDADNPDYAAALKSASAAMGAALPPTPSAPALLNVSTRLHVLSGDSVMICGFILTGSSAKEVVLRGLGPSLADNGVANVLADPVLELYDSSGQLIQQNDNWVKPLPADIVADGLQPSRPSESLIVATLSPGSYTAILRGASNSTGIALCELYDLDPTSSQVSNISTRGEVGTGDEAMIGGFILGGSAPSKVMIRALGPSLTAGGVAGALSDPTLELYGSDGSLLFQNDNWRSTQQQEIIDSTIPPINDKESAIIATLPAGNYTAIVRGVSNVTGVALVEVYDLQNN